ncbi:hypothetical protein FHO58_07840 [Escherichia coli]|nr:hypothetical protein [Escherichia coli]
MSLIQRVSSLLIALTIYLFLFDVILLGSGAWSINVTGISIRKVEYLTILLMVICTINNIKGYIYFCCATTFCLIFGVVVPFLNDVKLEYAITELLSFYGILLCPLIAQNRYISVNWKKIRKFILFICIISAFIHILIWLLGLMGSGYVDLIKQLCIRVLTANNDDLIDNIIIADTPDGLFRVLLPNSSLLIIGFYLSFQQYLNRKNYIHLLIVFVMLLALYTTWTRALYLSPIIVIGGVLFYKIFPFTLQLGKIGAYNLLSFIILFFIVISTVLVQPTLLSLLGIASESSDEIRYTQVIWIFNTFMNSPVLGTGLGGSAEDVRSLIAPWTYEMSLLALIMKLGLVGVFLFISISAIKIPEFLEGFFDGRRIPVKKVVWIYFSLSVLMMFSTNPFMLSFPGITITLFILCELNSFKIEKGNI